jgi:hypothetical protein
VTRFTNGRRSSVVTQLNGTGRAKALERALTYHLEVASGAPASVVYDLLADIRTHLGWAGTMQPKSTFRLLSVEAPEGPASVGTEFQSTGADAMGRFDDSSVVTEATRPSLFEFVTESRLSTKNGKLGRWTNIHRYELIQQGEGCRISYTWQAASIRELPGAMVLFKVPGLRSIGLRVAASNSRRGIRNLSRLAEERAAGRGKEGR